MSVDSSKNVLDYIKLRLFLFYISQVQFLDQIVIGKVLGSLLYRLPGCFSVLFHLAVFTTPYETRFVLYKPLDCIGRCLFNEGCQFLADLERIDSFIP